MKVRRLDLVNVVAALDFCENCKNNCHSIVVTAGADREVRDSDSNADGCDRVVVYISLSQPQARLLAYSAQGSWNIIGT